MAVVVGVDSSTSGTKVVVRDVADGTVLASGSAPHPPTTPPRSEQAPSAWWQALGSALASALASTGVGGVGGVGGGRGVGGGGGVGGVGRGVGGVAALSVAAQQHGLVALDAAQRVIRPAKLWNDTESAPDGYQLVAALGGPSAWTFACGSVPLAAFTITKLAWLKRVEPEAFARLVSVALPHDWVTLQLTGRLVTDRGDASGTGYWSPAEERWRPDLLALVDPARDWLSALPAVLAPSEAAGAVTPEAGRALGRDLGGALGGDLGRGRDIVVGPGTGDNMAAALGLGLQAGDVAVSAGTSGTVFAVTDQAVTGSGPAVAGFADATGRYLPLVCTLNASKVTDAFARLLGVDRAGFDQLALTAQPGAEGVVLLPYLDGERTPDRPGATGVLSGLRTTTTGAHVARACVEGVVCGLLDALDSLRSAGVDTTSGRLVLTGGAARSRAYGQVLADLTGRSVEVASEEELVARGAAIQAAAVLAGANPMALGSSWAPTLTHLVEPDPAADIEAIRGAYAARRDSEDREPQ